MYRESIGQFIHEDRAKLYVPKNTGLKQYVEEILSAAGVSASGEFELTDRAIGKFEILSARGEDIPQRIDDCDSRGEIAYGLTGDDLFDEYMLRANESPLGVLNTYDWYDPAAQYGRPALCLMNPTGQLPPAGAKVSVAVNKKYELTSRLYLAERFGGAQVKFDVIAYAGDTENTVKEGTHDGCVEIVIRGKKSPESALMATRLQIVEVVRFSDISLIGKKIANPWEEEYRRIVAVAAKPTESATSKLLADENRICKKIGEESAEFVRAFLKGQDVPLEYNGVIYAMMVAAAKAGVSWDAIEADLRARWQ
jgi:phosphoribosyl-ATP pyrophosphohydrolase